jgi:5-deoxy-glucuronate isomerase
MGEKLFRPAGTLVDGSDPVRLSAAAAGWTYCGLQVVRLGPGESRRLVFPGLESAVVPLAGDCTLDGEGVDLRLRGRPSVFEGIPDVAYLPLDSEVEISSAGGGRFAVATATADDRRPAFVVESGTVSIEVRGAGQATRVVNGLLSADVPGPQRLIVVEVITPAGNWSSYPPHKHDTWADGEVPMEEIYYYEIAGEEGFGFHRTYTTDGRMDHTVTVRNEDVFLVPRGYHGPCVAAPGYDMYYLNVMAGPDPQRRWLICNDPAHAWVMGEWPATPPDPRATERMR